jgi:CMP-N,N'-diacetyllegionaminic acid synthase
VHRTVVSTEDSSVAEIALKCGAEVPFIRPMEFAMDNTQDYPVLRHCLDYYESKGEIYDAYVLLRPTSPLRKPGLIEAGLDLFMEFPEASSVRAVIRASQHPYRGWQPQGKFISAYITDEQVHEPYNIPRQQLPIAYFQTGDIEIVRRQTIIDGSASGDHVIPLVIEDYIDIDEEKDILLAERTLKDL